MDSPTGFGVILQISSVTTRSILARSKEYEVEEIHPLEKCWLCGGPEPNTTIIVECETPGGKICNPKEVHVHLGCYLDMEP
jgi:hypothetical protein